MVNKEWLRFNFEQLSHVLSLSIFFLLFPLDKFRFYKNIVEKQISVFLEFGFDYLGNLFQGRRATSAQKLISTRIVLKSIFFDELFQAKSLFLYSENMILKFDDQKVISLQDKTQTALMHTNPCEEGTYSKSICKSNSSTISFSTATVGLFFGIVWIFQLSHWIRVWQFTY